MSGALANWFRWTRGEPVAPLFQQEWLVTNGLGGYASGTLGGLRMRRFHGLLVAALPPPLGRWMMFNQLDEEIVLADARASSLGTSRDAAGLAGFPEGLAAVEFRLENGLPAWRYEFAEVLLEKRIVLARMLNTTLVQYRVVEAPAGGLRLRLRPAFYFRPHEGPVDQRLEAPYTVMVQGPRIEVHGPPHQPRLRLQVHGPAVELRLHGGRILEAEYLIERARGYDHHGMLYCPGWLEIELQRHNDCVLIASVESWEQLASLVVENLLPAEHARRAGLVAAAIPGARSGAAAELVLAADDFIVEPMAEAAPAASAPAGHVPAERARTIIAGYHWFTDWGRDSMISLEGLLLVTGRHREAAAILRRFVHHVRDGLVPNLFPEGEQAALYHTADATLWLFHALDRYLQATGDRATLQAVLPTLIEILAAHRSGTRFGIGVDPADGLLHQGDSRYPLTWMDAKVGDWIVTPRRGKAVEINALYYNALRLASGWLHDFGLHPEAMTAEDDAERLCESFNRRFWNPATGCLFDVVDGEHGDDASIRPNQVLALALAHPVLDPARWPAVLAVVERDLLTPVGLRTLAPSDPAYQARYDGDLRSRDAAYHQGTVWPWLIGPFANALVRTHPGRAGEVAALAAGVATHLNEACLGTIGEIFDGDPPHAPRGCIAQAWSVAEVLRCLVGQP